MTTIKILGMGCPKCNKLAENAEAAAKGLGLQYTVEKVSNIEEIMKFGVMMTPALVINGEVKLVGKAPPAEEIRKILE